MKKLTLLLLLALTVSCSKEEYQEAHKYSNEYYYLNTNNLDSIYGFVPDYGKTVYKSNGDLNLEEFVKIPNSLVEIVDDTLKVFTHGDFLYFQGDKTSDQNWIATDYGHYLKMLNPVQGEHLLSVSIQNY